LDKDGHELILKREPKVNCTPVLPKFFLLILMVHHLCFYFNLFPASKSVRLAWKQHVLVLKFLSETIYTKRQKHRLKTEWRDDPGMPIFRNRKTLVLTDAAADNDDDDDNDDDMTIWICYLFRGASGFANFI